MTTPKTLNERVIEAKAIASLGRITSRDSHGRVRTVIVPGSAASQNRVIIRRHNGSIVSCECHKIIPNGDIPCQGNIHGVCRHSIAAIFISMADQGYTPRFRKDLEQAKQLAAAQSKIALSNPDTGNPVVLTLKSFQHANHMLHFAALETDLAKKGR